MTMEVTVIVNEQCHLHVLEIPPLLRSAHSRLNCGLWFAFIAASNTFIVLAFRGQI